MTGAGNGLMYVCICNALKDRRIREAAADAKNVGEVFRRCGTKPQCGKCLPDIAKLIEEERASAPSMRLAAE